MPAESVSERAGAIRRRPRKNRRVWEHVGRTTRERAPPPSPVPRPPRLQLGGTQCRSMGTERRPSARGAQGGFFLGVSLDALSARAGF